MDPNRGKLLSIREVIVLLLLALPLLVTVSTIEDAHWVNGLPSLKAVVLVSMVMWAFLARSAVPGWIGHSLAFLGGLVVAFVLGGLTLSEAHGLGDLASRLGSWFGAIGSQEGDRGALVTGVGLIAVTLWMGHATVWLAYHRSFALLGALPGLAVLLVVLTFLPTDYYWYFFMYLLAAAPGIAYRHKGRWREQRQRVSLLGAFAGGLVLMAATLVPVWRAPSPEGIVFPLESKFEKPWYSFREHWSNLFYGVPDRKDWTFFSPPRDLPFTGPIQPGDDLLFVVESEEPYRWRMRVYDTYTGSSWVSDETPVEVSSTEAPLQEFVEELNARKELEIRVRTYSKANTLVSVGEPVSASIPSDAELSPQPTFKPYYSEGSQVSYLPPEVKDYWNNQNLLEWFRPGREDPLLPSRQSEPVVRARNMPWSPPPSTALNELGFRQVHTSESSTGNPVQLPAQSPTPYIMLERTKSNPGPPLALLGQRVLVPPRQYRTVGSISVATPPMLREAGQDYPE